MRVCGVYFVFVILLSACTNGVSHLDIALQQAKHNKAELEKVLKHFKHDSLKYRAACFLIENMPGKYSILPYDSLDMDFRRVPFGPIPALLAIADEVTKVHAICVKCGNLAYATHRITKSEKRVLLGEKADYEPLCRTCYMEALKEETENK